MLALTFSTSHNWLIYLHGIEDALPIWRRGEELYWGLSQVQHLGGLAMRILALLLLPLPPSIEQQHLHPTPLLRNLPRLFSCRTLRTLLGNLDPATHSSHILYLPITLFSRPAFVDK